MSDEQGSTFATMANLFEEDGEVGHDATLEADEPTGPTGATAATGDSNPLDEEAPDSAEAVNGGAEPAATSGMQTIDVWVVDAVLGGGSDAVVYATHNVHAPRIRAAIKVPTTGAALGAGAQDRFLAEARLLAGLRHPHVVSVRNLRLDHSPPFIEMPLVDGPTLEKRLRRGALSGTELCTVAAGLCSAVGYLGQAGITHRDIKPGNVLLGESGPVLVDFGLACTREAAATERLAGAQGSLGYLPPEWTPDGLVDGDGWDRYALGVVLYECCVGRPAFPVDPERSRLEQLSAVQERVHGGGALDPGEAAPLGMRSLIQRLTAPVPSGRALDLMRCADLLEQAASGDPSADTQLWRLVDPDAAMGDAATLDPTPSELGATIGGPARWIVPLLAVGFVGFLAALGLRFVSTSPDVATGGDVTVRLALTVKPAESLLPVVLTLNGEAFEQAHPPVLSPGVHELGARVGEKCGTEVLPEWCGEVRHDPFQVAEDAREHVFQTLTLPEVSMQSVAFAVNGTKPARYQVDGGAWTPCPADDDCVAQVLPGPQRAFTLQAGDCPDEACDESCPVTCAEQTIRMMVPFEKSDSLSLAVELPTLQVTSRAPSGGRPVREAAAPAEARGSRLGPVITIERYQNFLLEHREFLPGRAGTRGKTDKRYLNRWSVDPLAPPSGTTDMNVPVSWVSPAMFEAYCQARGSTVASSEDGELVKDAGKELRKDGPRWVIYQAGDADPKPAGDPASSLGRVTVRCRQ